MKINLLDPGEALAARLGIAGGETRCSSIGDVLTEVKISWMEESCQELGKIVQIELVNPSAALAARSRSEVAKHMVIAWGPTVGDVPKVVISWLKRLWQEL
jgi:hypothetical protein